MINLKKNFFQFYFSLSDLVSQGWHECVECLRSSQAMAPPTIRLEANRSEAWKCLIKAFLLRIETAVVDDSVLRC